MTLNDVSASWRACLSSQRCSRTFPQRGCSNSAIASGSPQVSGSLNAKRSPWTRGRPRPLYAPGAPYKTRSRRIRTKAPHGSSLSGARKRWLPYLASAMMRYRSSSISSCRWRHSRLTCSMPTSTSVCWLSARLMETGSPQLLPGSGTQASTEYG